MLDGHTYWAFVAAVIILCIIPGPDMAYLLGRTITQGRRAGLLAALGINAGGYAHVIATVFGLSAVSARRTLQVWLNRLMGGLLVALGFRLASQKL